MFCYETVPKKTRLLLAYQSSIVQFLPMAPEKPPKNLSVLDRIGLLIQIPTARGTTSVLYLQRPCSKTYMCVSVQAHSCRPMI